MTPASNDEDIGLSAAPLGKRRIKPRGATDAQWPAVTHLVFGSSGRPLKKLQNVTISKLMDVMVSEFKLDAFFANDSIYDSVTQFGPQRALAIKCAQHIGERDIMKRLKSDSEYARDLIRVVSCMYYPSDRE